MAPGGQGVDVKHNSYARYLGKLKGKTMALGTNGGQANPAPTSMRFGVSAVTNNKSYRFTLVKTHECECNGEAIPQV